MESMAGLIAQGVGCVKLGAMRTGWLFLAGLTACASAARAPAADGPCPDGGRPATVTEGMTRNQHCLANGVRHGPTTIFRGDAVVARGAYHDGKRAGDWEFFDADGRRAYTGGFRDGEFDGVWTTYGDDGKPLGTATFERGTGTWVRWDARGLATAEGRCVDGLRDGSWTLHDPSGEPTVMTFALGVADGAWRRGRDGGEIKRGRREGPWIEWIHGDGGAVRYEGRYAAGRRIGVWTRSRADGAPLGDIDFDADPTGGFVLPFHEPLPVSLGRCEPGADAVPDPVGALEAAARNEGVWFSSLDDL
jgi:hypothetical protein